MQSQIKAQERINREQKEEITKLNEKLKILEEKWESMKKEVIEETSLKVLEIIKKEETIKRAVEEVTTNSVLKVNGEEMKNGALEKITEEWKEYRKARKNNIVMYNMPEPKESEPKDRENEDMTQCCDLLKNSLKMKSFIIEKVIRLGKRNEERVRPLLIKMKNENEKWEVLKKAKNLKHETDAKKKKVGIARDMTKTEREIETKLRRELIEKRQKGELDGTSKTENSTVQE